MTDKETQIILAMIETNWQKFPNQRAAESLWAEAFREDPFPLVRTAVMALINSDSGDFRPNIAKVRRKMHDIVYGERISETEAWQLIKAGMHEAQSEPETLGGARSAWAKLPEDIRKLVSPRQLLDWNSVETVQLDTVIQSNFMRSYREVRDRQYSRESVPAETARQIEAIRSASGLFKDPEKRAELPQPKKLAFEKPDWMIRREEMELARG